MAGRSFIRSCIASSFMPTTSVQYQIVEHSHHPISPWLFQKYLEGLFIWQIYDFCGREEQWCCTVPRETCYLLLCALNKRRESGKRREMQDWRLFQRKEIDTAILLCQYFPLITEVSAQWAGKSTWEKEIALTGKYQIPGNSCPKLLLSLKKQFNNQTLEALFLCHYLYQS